MRSPLAGTIARVALGTITMAAAVGARPADPGLPPPHALPPERPLQAVLDVALGRVVVNRARGVRIEGVNGGPPLRFTLVNTTGRRQPIRIGILHLPKGDYDVHTLGVTGASRHTGLSSSHLAAGWRFLLAPPQTETRFGRTVRRLTEAVRKTQLLLTDRVEPELTKALTPLEAAVRRAGSDLTATRRLQVVVVPTGTQAVPLPPRGPALSEAEMKRRGAELDRLQRDVVAAADRSGDRALANRVRQWFRVPVEPSGVRRKASGKILLMPHA